VGCQHLPQTMVDEAVAAVPPGPGAGKGLARVANGARTAAGPIVDPGRPAR
jgi:hypothetical protein